jgi:hypothetical protein
MTPRHGNGRLVTTGGGFESRHRGVRVRKQSGILRSNCIDCLDRTNVVQCIFGLLVLGVQLRELELSDTDYVDHDSSMAMELMEMCGPARARPCTLFCMQCQSCCQNGVPAAHGGKHLGAGCSLQAIHILDVDMMSLLLLFLVRFT